MLTSEYVCDVNDSILSSLNHYMPEGVHQYMGTGLFQVDSLPT